MNSNKLPKNQENPQLSDKTPRDTGERTLSLLQKIQAGTVNPKCIRPDERRLIVSYLMADGYATADMAQILKISDRSIERDKKAIREANALAATPELVEQVVGRLCCEAELSIQRIRKAARDKNTPSAVKVDAEYRCFQIINQMTISLQHLGYLPTATAKLQADITHNIGQVPELSHIELEYQRLKRISGESQWTDSQLTERFNLLQAKIAKVSLVNELNEVSNLLTDKEDQNESK